MGNKAFDVTALGELLIDFTENGSSAQGNPMLEANPGGAPCNVLAMLEKLGKKTAFIGKVGNDMFGTQLKNAVEEVGIDTRNLVIDNEVHTTLAFVHTYPDVLFVVMGITISQAFMLPGFLLAGLYFVFDIFSQKDYEYMMENGQFEIDVIYGKKYRKTAHILELSNLETVAPHWHESVARYKKNGGTEKLKKYDYTSYDEDTPYYTMIIREDGHKIKLLLDLNEELLHAMKTQYPEKVYFA